MSLQDNFNRSKLSYPPLQNIFNSQEFKHSSNFTSSLFYVRSFFPQSLKITIHRVQKAHILSWCELSGQKWEWISKKFSSNNFCWIFHASKYSEFINPSTMQNKWCLLQLCNIEQDASPTPSVSNVENTHGVIHLTLLYDPIAGILSVRLIEAQDLQPRDFSGTADPYCKIRLLPNKTNVWQTRIHKRTLNPVFDEDFVFEERPAVIGRRTLEILLYDFDAYSRHMSIGSAQISLAHVDLSDKVEIWRALTSCTEQDAKVELGEIMVSLSYLPSAERLTVVLIKARNLRVVDDSRNSTGMAQISLLLAYKWEIPISFDFDSLPKVRYLVCNPSH